MKSIASISIKSGLIIFLILISGCRTTKITTTKLVPVMHETKEIPDTELLDVGIRIFDPGLDNVDELDEDQVVFPEIRNAESNYFPYLLMETIQSSAAWGAVRVVPVEHEAVDVMVKGKILQSDGEILEIEIDVTDASNEHWYKKTYSQQASHYSYTNKAQLRQETFQNVYNNIANDLYKYQQTLSVNKLKTLHLIAELKFAKSFAPQQFSDYLTQNKAGIIKINRLPAKNDKMMARIRQVRERDYLFIDTLQEYYGSYVKDMRLPYQDWRRESYVESTALKNMQRKATAQKLLGAASILAGILAAGKSNASARAASAVAVAGGAYLLKEGFDRSSEAQIHIDAIQELGDSLEASIGSHVIELEDRTVTLTGSVNNQYKQWRKILLDIYKVDFVK